MTHVQVAPGRQARVLAGISPNVPRAAVLAGEPAERVSRPGRQCFAERGQLVLPARLLVVAPSGCRDGSAGVHFGEALDLGEAGDPVSRTKTQSPSPSWFLPGGVRVCLPEFGNGEPLMGV